jgi:hypothetical protein
LYSVASAIFSKKYWLYLWDDKQNKVDEPEQLANAVKWVKTYKISNYGRTNKEITRTSFITSTNNSYEDVDFDMFKFNHYISDAWFCNTFNAMEGFPEDIPANYISEILVKVNDDKCKNEEWLKWVRKFKNQYQNLGCVVD